MDQTIKHSGDEEIMITIKKCLILSLAEATGIFIMMLIFTAVRHRHHIGTGEKTGNRIDNTLKESKTALEKAAAHLLSVLEQIKNRKN